MTAEEFEQQYAARTGITVQQLRELGRIVAPCHCGEDMCEGWQSTTQERLDEEEAWKRIEGAGDPMDCLPPDPKHLAARGVRKKRGAK